MPKQEGENPITGTFGDLNFYKRKGQYLVRQKPGPSAERNSRPIRILNCLALRAGFLLNFPLFVVNCEGSCDGGMPESLTAISMVG